MTWASEQAQAVFETLDGAFDGDGIVVAVTVIDDDGPAFSRSAGLPEDARFEIGSITKTMTATLLASLVGDAVVALDDEIGRWLDAGPNADITLEQLATHTSGLPRLAPNQPTEETNPYRDFTAAARRGGAAGRIPDARRRSRLLQLRLSVARSRAGAGQRSTGIRTCWRTDCSGRWG